MLLPSTIITATMVPTHILKTQYYKTVFVVGTVLIVGEDIITDCNELKGFGKKTL